MKRLLLLPLLTAAAFAQGPLTPPSMADPRVGPVAPLDGSGNPQPTMKTLHQVEPRVPVQALAASAPYAISQPGSYYLTDNITVAIGDAIVVSCNDVSLDLNGFTIKSTMTGGTSGNAISITGGRSRLSVRNGSIVSSTTVPASGAPVTAGFLYGIYSDGYIMQVLVADLKITGMGGAGMWLDGQGIVERCTVANCGGNGIQADEIHDCIAKNCYGNAIDAMSNATNCTGVSISAFGVFTTANASGCAGSSTTGYGLYCNGNALNCTGISGGAEGLKASESATNCKGESGGEGTAGLVTKAATNCIGSATSGTGLWVDGNALNCTGTSTSGTGLYTKGNATNCNGTSTNGIGLLAEANATTASGTSSTNAGLRVYGNASNCTGTTAGTYATGLWADGTASYCFGKTTGGASSTGLHAAIAIGCTFTGSLSVPAGKSFNM
jgi:hypothetical protein